MAFCCAGRGQLLPSDAVVRRYGRWRQPEVDKAELAHRAEHAHHDFFDVWSARVRDLKEFGVGHMMYFHFIRWMSVLFGVLSLLSGLPCGMLNLLGRYYDGGNIELTSLGNFGRTAVTHDRNGPTQTPANASMSDWEREAAIARAFMADADAPPATARFNKAAAVVAMSVLDAAAALGYVVTDYSVCVQRLPADTTAEELSQFFGQYGEVVHVEVVRAYRRLVRLVLQRGQLMRALASATATLQREAQEWDAVPAAREEACFKLRDELQQLELDIQAEQEHADAHRAVGAFVTFCDEAGKLACLRAQPRSRVRQLFTQRPEHKLRGRHALVVRDAPEPSDVQFEHMEHGTWERAGRAGLVAAASYGALAVGFLLISLASALRLDASRAAGVNSLSCAISCRLTVGGALGLSEQDRERYAHCANGGSGGSETPVAECSAEEASCYRCYCHQALMAGKISERLYCAGAARLLLVEWSSLALGIVAILVINLLLSMSARALTRFEKHHTRSAEARSLAHKLFLAQFLNSAVSTIIAYAHLPILAHALDGSPLAGVLFQGIFTDLTPNWYKVVGRSLVISQVVAAVLRALNLAIRVLVLRWRRRRRSRCVTQHELQQAMRGPHFELDTRYGEHLNVVYVCMLLSGGLPIAYAAATLWFVSAYWCDKVELLSLSRRPITYGADLSNMVMDLLPFAAVWHVGFALWAFSMLGVPRSAIITPGFAALVQRVCEATRGAWAAGPGLEPAAAAARLLAANSAHLLVTGVVLTGLLFVKVTFTYWLRAGRTLLSLLGVIGDAEDDEAPSGAPDFAVAVRTRLLVGESTYAIVQQPSYAAAFRRDAEAGDDVLVRVVLRARGESLAAAGAAGGAAKGASPRTPSGISYELGADPTCVGIGAGAGQPRWASAPADGSSGRWAGGRTELWEQAQRQALPQSAPTAAGSVAAGGPHSSGHGQHHRQARAGVRVAPGTPIA